VVMTPLHNAVVAAGCTLIIRGQRDSDTHKSPLRSGDCVEGFEFLFPIESWSDAKVMAFLKARNAPIPPYYETMKGAPDCITCTGWWSENHGQYLKKHHPDAYRVYQARLRTIMDETMPHIANFNRELDQEQD